MPSVSSPPRPSQSAVTSRRDEVSAKPAEGGRTTSGAAPSRAPRASSCGGEQTGAGPRPFWEVKQLKEMSGTEWESLCDGCGRCCLVRFEDEVTGEVIPTRVACRLLDTDTCRCTNYVARKRHVPDCIKLTPRNVANLHWMPSTCAYRRIHEGRGLAAWHPLVSGDPLSVVRAGISVSGQVVSETALADVEDALDFEAPELGRDPSERLDSLGTKDCADNKRRASRSLRR